MAVSSVSSSSIYGNRNVITGLASGMDTESMIENAISAYKNKIASLNQKRTKTLWKQDAYRSIISKMSSFTSKYTSYQSSNNLMATSFWNQAVKTVSKGANADKVTATGRSSSNVQINRVLQLATAATYKYNGSALDKTTSSFGADKVASSAGGILDLDGTMEVSGLSGSLTLAYGGANALSYLSINFDDTTVYEGQTDENGNPISAEQALVNEINRQLETQSVTIGSKTYTGKELTENVLRAELQNGKITFTDLKGNNVYVSSAKGLAEGFLDGRKTSTILGEQVKDLALTDSMRGLLGTQTKDTLDYLEGKSASISITLDGVSKTIKLPTASSIEGYDELEGDERDAAYLKTLQERIDEAFGKGKLTVSDANGKDAGIQFKFEAAKGSTFSVSSSQGEVLGFGESKQVTSYLNTGKTLGELLSGTDFSKFAKADGKDANGKQLYAFVVNGVEIGKFNEDSTLSDVMNAMNSNSKSGVSVSYSKLTNELTFTAKETGAASEIKFEGLAAALFGAPGTYDDDGKGVYTKGQNALFEATVNGTSLGLLERSSNNVDLDGMTVNLKGTFGYETNADGSIKYNTSYETDADGRILFTAGNGKTFHGALRDDGSGILDLYDELGNPVKHGDSDVYGRMDSETGKLTFHMKGNEESEIDLYLTDKGGFAETDNKTYYDNTKNINGKDLTVFSYGEGKEIYGEIQDDGTVKLYNANGKELTYRTTAQGSDYEFGAPVFGVLGDDGELSFYVQGVNGGTDVQLYARADGSGFTRNKSETTLETARTEVTRTNGYTAGTTVTKTPAEAATEAVTFETSSDADKIVDAVKQMIEDYNAMVTEIKNAYSTLPLQRSSGAYYEPLTEDEEADMSESAINSWNENAKTGILFGDSDLRSLYTRLTSAISLNGEFGATLRAAGITVNYSDGLSTLSFDENKFRTALENDPDKVRDAFVSSAENGASANGLMQSLKVPLDMYGKTTGGKGILVEKAGSPLAATTLYTNTMQKELDNIDKQIEKWQDLMSNQIDYYTGQFSRLEQLILQMNSQSSYFSQLMGGY